MPAAAQGDIDGMRLVITPFSQRKQRESPKVAPSETPTIWPASLIAAATLPTSPGSIPRPMISAPGVHRNAPSPKGPSVDERPTTCPAALMPNAKLVEPPGSVPMSTVGPPFQKNP